MTPLEQVQHLYETYLEKAMEAEKKTPYAAGLFGMGKKASDDPCHDQFIQNLTALMNQFKEEGTDSAALRETLAYIYQAPARHPEPASVYWMLIAAHSATPGIIPLLNRDDAAALYAQYDSSYKRWGRLPVQTQVLKQLDKARK